MNNSAYSLFGAKLIERGYCAVPAFPGTKVPGTNVAGAWRRMADWTRRYRDRLPSDREVETWERAADGGICLIMGKASSGVVAVDIDTDEAVAPVTNALPYTPVKKRGAKGETLFFRNPNNVVSRAFTLVRPDGRRQRLVDMLSEGRQTVLPPTTHPDTGKPYTWTGERELADVDPADLPDLPADALDRIAIALAPLGYSPDRDRAPIAGKATSSDDDKSPFRLLNEHALANLDAWAPRLPLSRMRRTGSGFEAVADWRPSNTGRPIDRRKLNLKLSAAGIVDFGDGPKGYTAIDLVQACGVAYGDAAFGWLADATGWGSSVVHAPQPRATIVEQGVTADAETGEVISSEPAIALNPPESKASEPISSPPWKSPIDPTRCPGLVGRIADWIVATAEYQQPLLAIGAALTIVGTVAGRQLAGPTKSGTHLYTIGVVPTGGGKDHALKSIGRVLLAAKLPHLIGASKFTSETAVVNTVLRSPACACAMDEFGAFLARGKARSATTHELGISSLLRTLWSSSFDTVPTTERAGEQFKLIHSPALALYGTSTAEEFYDALGDADTRNGLLNRFLILENPKRPQRVKAALDRNAVPEDIAEDLRAIYWRLGELGAAPYHGQGDTAPPPPIQVAWRDAGAERAYDDLVHDLQTRMDAETDNERYLVRTAEMAVRIATIRAVGIDPDRPVVSHDDMIWGATVALASAQAMIEGARDRISESYWQKATNMVIDVLKRAKKPLKSHEISAYMRGRMKSKEITEVLSELCEHGRVERIDVTDKRSDTKKVTAFSLRIPL